MTTQNGPASASKRTTGPQKSTTAKSQPSVHDSTETIKPLSVIEDLPWVFIDAWYDGSAVHAVVPATPPNAPADVREGTTLRRAAMLNGTCPECGARRVIGGNRAVRRRAGAGAVGTVRVVHRPSCAGSDRALAEAVARWQSQWDQELADALTRWADEHRGGGR